MRRKHRRYAWLLLMILSSSGPLVEGFVCPPRTISTIDGSVEATYESYHDKFSSLKAKDGDGDCDEDYDDDDDAFQKKILPAEDATPEPKRKSQNPKTVQLEQDIAKKLSASRNRAISALSQPNPKDRAISELSKSTEKENESSLNRNGKTLKEQDQPQPKGESLLPKAPLDYSKTKRDGRRPRRTSSLQNNQRRSTSDSDSSFHSLLPPPIKTGSSGFKGGNEQDSLSDGLSSWEDFLGGGSSPSPKKDGLSSSPLYRKSPQGSRPLSTNKKNLSRIDRNEIPKKSFSATNKNLSSLDGAVKLPSIADLFPPDLSTALNKNKDSPSDAGSPQKKPPSVAPPPLALNGVLPVSDLFYRSAQSMNAEEDESSSDDEELPFSAEQSDQLTTDHNKIKIRRNRAKRATLPAASKSPRRRSRKLSAPRKMVRRGMEMLVGGVPINADPPQRYIDLLFRHEKTANWDEVISINSRDFGPMLHSSSIGQLPKIEKGLFCEHFVHAALKWDVCPKDLKAIVKSHTSTSMDSAEKTEVEETESPSAGSNGSSLDDSMDDVNATHSVILERNDTLQDVSSFDKEMKNEANTGALETSGGGFGLLKTLNQNPTIDSDVDDVSALQSHLGGELIFSIGVSREELESADSPDEVPVLERVLARGIAASTECTGFSVCFIKLVLTDMDDGTTMVSGEFKLSLKENESMDFAKMEKKAQRINSALGQAMDDGDMQLAMAAAAREETGWPETLRDRVVEEFLFEDDDGDGPLDDDDDDDDEDDEEDDDESIDDVADEQRSSAYSDVVNTLENVDFGQQGTVVPFTEIKNTNTDEYDGPFGMPGSVVYHKDDIFLGGGNDGVFWDYSEDNAKGSPYGGTLGLRLVDAVVERAKERHPRVIAIGDVHGCIDELQDLLRECDFRPGDLVVFLGDLVSKGPDSIAVVQMAREIGAIGIRGNHDFEVIRWHQAIKSGVDPPVVGSEHFHIASCLSNADMKWMYSLPWFISSKELGALFVHAGFVSGIRLAKQNPRLMMNMRSILPDGTVTSKFFNNWPWARLWDGPQTVLFGHDADRGLQQYEHAIGLDTGCVYGGRLTACILPEKRLVSVSARREYFKYRRKHYD